MITFTSKEAKNDIGKVFRAAQSTQVVITDRGTPVLSIAPFKPADYRSDGNNQHDSLDHMKHRISCEVLSRFPLSTIRDRSRENLKRWFDQGTWGQPYDEWMKIIDSNDDLALISRMVGLDEDSNRLRQSMPYVGMLEQSLVRNIHLENPSLNM